MDDKLQNKINNNENNVDTKRNKVLRKHYTIALLL